MSDSVIAALVVSIFAALLALFNTGIVLSKEFNMFTYMTPNQSEAFRQLISDARNNGAKVRKVLWVKRAGSVKEPLFDFPEVLKKVRQNFTEFEGNKAQSGHHRVTNPNIEYFRGNHKQVGDAAGSSAYQLAAMLHGTPKTKDDDIKFDAPSLRFDGNRCLFKANGEFYWALITSVYTVWDDPEQSGPLRARSPWGITTFYVVNREVFAHFKAASVRTVENLQGLCRHFDLWEHDEDDVYTLNEINEANFCSSHFGVHMQEHTAAHIYKYAMLLVTSAGIRKEEDLRPIPGQRTRNTYRFAAISLFEEYLKRVAPNDEANWRSEYTDQARVGGLRPEIPDDQRIRSQHMLRVLMESTRGDLAVYKTFIAIKLLRLMRKAAVYDDRFSIWGCRDGDIWIG